MRLATKPRKGTHVVECAVVYPFVFFIILATIVGGLGIFRYQQMAFLSREASRYCATHAASYTKENYNSSHPTSPTAGVLSISAGTLPGTVVSGNCTVDANYVINNVIIPQASILNTTNINSGGPMTVTINYNSQTNSSWPTTWQSAATTNPPSNVTNYQTSVNGFAAMVTNTVSVTITYQWTPELIIWNQAGPITLQSTSVMPLSY
jgi:hypothetical protein